jgi:uncharacterized protein YbgA (DUF1722 family)
MPLTTHNLETLINMLNALAQRQETVRQLASQLHTGTLWRSVDGQLSVALSEAQRTELEEFIDAYLSESEVLIASVRAMVRQA